MGKTKIKKIEESQTVENREIEDGKIAESTLNPQDSIVNTQSSTVKKYQKPGKRHKIRSKKYQQAAEDVNRADFYPVTEAVQLAKKVSYTKFDGSLEIHINTSVKGVRTLVALPFASGKKLKVLAFGKGAKESGAEMVGDDAKLAEIEKGKIDFDILVSTPEWMPKLARAAKVLGPKGLMPNPKNNTVNTDLKKAVAEIQSGKVEYKTEPKANVIHLSIGKISQPSEQLVANAKILLSTIGKTKIKKASLSPTMGIGIKLDLSSI